jgi:hypothetical protein
VTDYLASAGSSVLGICAILAIAFLLSSGKKRINLRVVGAAFALQAVMALLVLRTDVGVTVIQGLSNGVISLLGYSVQGIETLFGPMDTNPFANTFLIAALPVIVFFAALVSILYYLGIMQRLVRWLGGAIGWVTGISKVEALGSAANIFVGQSESPLVVRPYLAALPPSRLFTLMCVGMAGVAGTILAAYAAFLGDDAVPYLLAAAFMSAPGGILMAKIIMPDDPAEAAAHDKLLADVTVSETFEEGEKPANVIEAAAQGYADRRQAGGRGGRDGDGVCGSGGAGQRAARRCGRVVRLSRCHLPAIARISVRAGHVPDRHFGLGAGADRRRPVRDKDRAQRIRRLYRTGRGRRSDAAHARGADVCAVRLCQFLFDRDPDGGDRGARPQPATLSSRGWA